METWFHPSMKTHFVFLTFIMELESKMFFPVSPTPKKKRKQISNYTKIHILPIRV